MVLYAYADGELVSVDSCSRAVLMRDSLPRDARQVNFSEVLYANHQL